MAKKQIVKKIRRIVERRCDGRLRDIMDYHILPVVDYSISFGKQLDADCEVTELAAWLHDIRKLKGERNNHHIRGSIEAGKILKKLNYPIDRIDRVKECILTHSSDKEYPPISIEAKIVAAADALSHFDNFPNLCRTAYSARKYSTENGRIWLIEKYKSSWSKILFPEAVELAQPKYEAIMLLLSKR